jgi:predicted TPR repeat methyltransferase
LVQFEQKSDLVSTAIESITQKLNWLPSMQHSSGDMLVDRRYLYARAAAAEGDYESAADVLEQTRGAAPRWAPLWMALAAVYEKSDRMNEAIAALRRVAALDAEGELGAELHLARLGVVQTPKRAPELYVQGLFDQYADHFEAHLVDQLAYRGPFLLADALARLGARQFGHVIDLGCGTGLCGAIVRASSQRLSGVDLSQAMIEIARKRGIYDRLETAAMEDFLRREPQLGASLVLAADVFIYVGDLAPVIAAAARALEPGGFFAFTAQRAMEGAYKIGPDLRFFHSDAYVSDVVHAAGMRVCLMEPVSARRDAGFDVPGLIVVACA